MTCITCLVDCLGGRMIDLQGSPSWNEKSRCLSGVWEPSKPGKSWDLIEELSSWSWVNIPMIYGIWYIPGGCLGFLPSTISWLLVSILRIISCQIISYQIISFPYNFIILSFCIYIYIWTVLFFLKLELVPMMEYHIVILYFYPPCGDTFESLYKHWINHIFMTQIGWRTCVEHFLNSIARCSTAGALARQNPSNKNTASPCHPCWLSDIGVQVHHVYTYI